MAEPKLSDYISLNIVMNQSLVCALIGAEVLDPSDIAATYRNSAEALPNEVVASELRAFAERWEAVEAHAGLLAPGWTPEVVAGGKDGGGKDGGD